MSHLNIEIKAKIPDLVAIRYSLQSLGAKFHGTDHQLDTYFQVKSGRLKIREGNIENRLIYYEREEGAKPKKSVVTLFDTPANSNLKEILAKSLGVVKVIDKKREIYFINNVKFHLDEVSGLGVFFEIEAIDKDGSLGVQHLRQQCERYLELLNISNEDLIPASYCDMV